MKIQNLRKRKAISPVLATVILIAITLIAAIAIAGFVFGLFGSFTSSAQVQVVNAPLAHTVWVAACTTTCTVTFTNTGTSNVNVNSFTLTYAGTTCSPTIAAAVTIPATGAQTGVTFNGAGTCLAGLVGQSFTGNAVLSNGGQVPFSGTFS